MSELFLSGSWQEIRVLQEIKLKINGHVLVRLVHEGFRTQQLYVFRPEAQGLILCHILFSS